jgi:hypothetical protein
MHCLCVERRKKALATKNGSGSKLTGVQGFSAKTIEMAFCNLTENATFL